MQDSNMNQAGSEWGEAGCRHCEPLLSSYLLEELAPAEMELVAAHVRGCSACREELEALRATAQALTQHLPRVDSLSSLERERILVAARSKPAATRSWARWGGLAAAAAVLIAAVTGLVLELGARKQAATELAAAARERALMERDRVQLAAATDEALSRAPAAGETVLALRDGPSGAASAGPAGWSWKEAADLERESLSWRPGSDPALLKTQPQARGTLPNAKGAAPTGGAGPVWNRELDAKAADPLTVAALIAPAPAQPGAPVPGQRFGGAAGELQLSESLASEAAKADGTRQLDRGRANDFYAYTEDEKARSYYKAAPLAGVGTANGATPTKAAPLGAGLGAGGAAGGATRFAKKSTGAGAGGSAVQSAGAPSLPGASPPSAGATVAGAPAAGSAAAGAAPAAAKKRAGARFVWDVATAEKAPQTVPPQASPAQALPAPATEARLETERRRSLKDALGRGGLQAGGRETAQPGANEKEVLGEQSAQAGQQREGQRGEKLSELSEAKQEGLAAGGLDGLSKLPDTPFELGFTKPADPSPQPIDWKARVDDFLTQLDRQPGETPKDMFFRYWGTSSFVEAADDPRSTFAVDVDTASYTLFRSYLYQSRSLPPPAAIRTEEFINYFKSGYAAPPPPNRAGEEPATFAIYSEVAPSPFAHETGYLLFKVGIKGREVALEKRKACALVFVVDTSGSMRQGNRLETVKEALRLLVPQLDEGDTVGIVAFDYEARTILEPVAASQRERILDAIGTLEPRRNTNVDAGLRMGYVMAAAHRIKGGTNRVILLSDGVANTGVTDPREMLERVRQERRQGIYLTCVGVGMGNVNDAILEELADNGDGQCVYVDRLEEAKRVFVDNLTGSLEAIARDVKIQVEFDPSQVLRYRLLGYENRALADASFRDNTVDAGEVGAGHEVVALYEVKPRDRAQGPVLSPLGPPEGKLATVRVRHLTVEHGEAQEISKDASLSELKATFAEASPRFRFTACVAEAAEVLRESYWSRGSSLEKVGSMLDGVLPQLGEDKDAMELAALIKRADPLVRARDSAYADVRRAVDEIKENNLLLSRVEDELKRLREDDPVRAERFDDFRRRSVELRRQLEELLVR